MGIAVNPIITRALQLFSSERRSCLKYMRHYVIHGADLLEICIAGRQYLAYRAKVY